MHLTPLLIFALLQVSFARKPSNAILLSTVKSLTLRGNARTSARRVSAIPQLKCVGGNAQGLYDVDVMRCKNTGSEYGTEDISWTCQAELPSDFKLGSTEVICEGYDSADDPYVLKGSCGVEYRLMLTAAGESKYGKHRIGRSINMGGGLVNAFFTGVFWLVFLGVAGFLLIALINAFLRAGPTHNRAPRRRFGGFGGGHGGDDNDPPPPYTPRAPKRTRPESSPRESRWQPGFWTGAATGAAAGYAFGNRNSNRNNQAARAAAPAQAGPSNWFSRSTTSNQASNSYTGSSGASSSTPRYESTGFGGTRRR